MSTAAFLTVFPRQLRFWAIHCTLNALPSFCIALALFRLWESPSGIAAMCCGVATYILFYSFVTSTVTPLASESGVFARSLRAGAKVRSSLAAIALVTFVCNLGISRTGFGSAAGKAVSLGYVADFYCGMMATRLLEILVRAMKPLVLQFGLGNDAISFLKIYLTTVIEGLILSFILITISFFALIFLQARDRRKSFAVADSP